MVTQPLIPSAWLEPRKPGPVESQIGTARREGWTSVEELANYLKSINETMRQHGFGQNARPRDQTSEGGGEGGRASSGDSPGGSLERRPPSPESFRTTAVGSKS
jgi:hypothetical protein